MGKGNPGTLEVEVVLFGFVDPRVDVMVPYGFAARVDREVAVFSRQDIVDYSLPEVFSFTVKNLPAVIIRRVIGAGYKDGLYDSLLKNCFDCPGSFRCWEPVIIHAKPQDLLGIFAGFRDLVDGEMKGYAEKVQGYIEECTPTPKAAWGTTIQPEKVRRQPMPKVAAYV